jgi:hypothetical protein
MNQLALIITSERLDLRPFRSDDAAVTFAAITRGVARFMNLGGCEFCGFRNPLYCMR